MTKKYDLGALKRIREIPGGYCNTSYAVWMVKGDQHHQYLLRLYNPGTARNEILFEHALLDHLRSNGFIQTASIIGCRNDETLVQTPPPDGHPGTAAYWALFEFLDGEDRYSWTNTDLTDKEFSSAAEILARLHDCGHGFKKPPGADRAQPRIMQFLPAIKNRISGFMDRAGDRRCDRILQTHFHLICDAIDDAISLDTWFQGMPEMPIHCDYHPGNLKFSDEGAVGLFDFDWSRVDYRLFDVALGLVYFTSLWNTQAPGLKSDKFALFLSTYHQACRRLAHSRPLTDQEHRGLVPMLSVANLYVLDWELSEYYENPESDDDEHFMFIDHTIGLLHWIRSNRAELELWVEKSLNQAGK